MLIYFVAILITIGFWSKMSADQELKIRNASWLRTYVYGVLALFLLMFYIKTNEVPVIKQQIDISAVRCAVDSATKKIQDRACVTILNRYENNKLMSSLNDYISSKTGIKPDISDYILQRGEWKRYNVKYEQNGGVIVKLGCANDSTTRYVDNPNRQSLIEGFNIPFEYNHFYVTTMFLSRISSILPFEGHVSPNSIECVYDSLSSFFKIFSGSILDYSKSFELPGTQDYFGHNGIVIGAYAGTRELKHNGFNNFIFPVRADFLNTMNVLSAADLSQCTYVININSDCPLNELYMNFDIPVELLPSKFNPDQMDAYDIAFFDSLKLATLNEDVMMLHFKFPTMQNVQLVRSLILTTLLTAMLSLFFTNFYFAFKKSVRRKKILSKKIDFRTVWKIRKYWINSIYDLIFFISTLVGALVVARWMEYYIMVDTDNIPYYNWGVFTIILIIVVYYYFYLRKILRYKCVSNSSDNTSNNENIIKNDNSENDSLKEGNKDVLNIDNNSKDENLSL